MCYVLQEAERFNRLLKVIHYSIKELARAIKGDVVMSQELENVGTSMYTNQVPPRRHPAGTRCTRHGGRSRVALQSPAAGKAVGGEASGGYKAVGERLGTDASGSDCAWEGSISGMVWVTYSLFLYHMLYELLDPWCSSLPLQEVGNVSETSHRSPKVLADGERDDLVTPGCS